MQVWVADKLKRALLIAWIIFTTLNCRSQDKLTEIRKLIEAIAEEQALSGDLTDIEVIAVDLEYFFKTPLNLNTASYADLNRLWVLNDFQIRSLLEYREQMGEIRTMSEIQYVFGFNEITVQLISPFVVIGSAENTEKFGLKPMGDDNRFEYLLRSGWRSYDAESYNGNALSCYTRLTGNLDQKINMGFLAEHDAGETFQGRNTKYGFDFYSGYLQFTGKKFVRQITLGDFRIQSGQGLLLMNGYATGKTGEISSAKNRSKVINGNTSKDEYNFLRGVSSSFTAGKFNLTLFGTAQYRDASVDSLSGTAKVNSVYTTGYHRTNSEIKNRNAILEKSTGAVLQFKSARLNAGLNFLHSEYSLPLAKQTKVYKQKSVTGSQYQGVSFDYSLLLQGIQIYGEIAYANNSPAVFTGLCFMPASQFLLTFSHRYYSPSYFSPYGNGFSENGKTRNEEGFYTGIKWSSLPGIIFTGYADFYSYPWFSYSTDAILRGKEFMAGIEWMVLPDLELGLRYRFDTKDKNAIYTEQPTNTIEAFEKQNLRVQLRYQLSENTTLTTRFEESVSRFQQNTSPGFLIFQDIQYQLAQKYAFTFRYALFQIESFDSRIYAYEHDVLYAYSVPSYYGNGLKLYLLFRYRITSSVTVWLRGEHTNYFEQGKADRNGIRSQLIMRF